MDLVTTKNEAVAAVQTATATSAHIAARTSILVFAVMLLGAIGTGLAGAAAARRSRRAG